MECHDSENYSKFTNIFSNLFKINLERSLFIILVLQLSDILTEGLSHVYDNSKYQYIHQVFDCHPENNPEILT